MPRPKTITDEAILEAARAVFLEQGFQATTAEVAKRAEISEGSVFKRFRSKFELFQAAMLPSIESVDWSAGLADRVGRGDIKDNLVALGHAAIAFFRNAMPLLMMSWSNPGPNGIPAILAQIEPPPVKAIKRLSAYFEAEMKVGRLRRVDPEVLARTFTGGLIQFVMFELVLQSKQILPLPEATYLRSLVEILWSGVAGPTDPTAGNTPV